MKKAQHPLTSRQAYLLFMKGALNEKTGEFHVPARIEAMREFMDGAQAVQMGQIVINDPDAMRKFICNVEAGNYPPRH
ncbi:hypothetical protein [Tritonibacter mobilis]|uniref:hypothetical protein n=1 Tax=Tritonibacter mobilis TaxID=379347 RepID=UPI000806B740|nr:hypothetical protein [Tritonibacter mobilis]